MLPLAWSDWTSGSKRTAANPLAGNSTILQAAERVAKGILESHAGWLARDVSELVGAWRKRKLAKLDAGSNVSPSSQDAIQKICRELYAINRAKAWRAKGEGRLHPPRVFPVWARGGGQ
jgi:hypothetical protein